MFHNIMINEWQIYEGRHRWIEFRESIKSCLYDLGMPLRHHNVLWSDWGTTDPCGPCAAPPTADSLRKPTQALRSLSIKLVLPPSLTRTRGGLTLIQRRRNKISRGDDCHHELGFTFVMFPHRKRQEVAITTEIFLKHRAKSATRNIAIIATWFVTDRVRTAYYCTFITLMQSQLY